MTHRLSLVHIIKAERFQLETMRSLTLHFWKHFRRSPFSVSATYAFPTERFSVDDRRNASKSMPFRAKTRLSGRPDLTRRFLSLEYRAMLYSRLETQKKKREKRKYKPTRAKRQKTLEEPKVNISNTGRSSLSINSPFNRPQRSSALIFPLVANLGVVCSFVVN